MATHSLQSLHEDTIPVEVVASPTITLTFHMFTCRTTIGDKKELADTMYQAEEARQVKGRALDELEEEEAELLKPAEKLRKQGAELRAQFDKSEDDAERTRLIGEVDALQEQYNAALKEARPAREQLAIRTRKATLDFEEASHDLFAQELAFYTKRIELTDENGNEEAPTYDFFRKKFPYRLLEKSVDALRSARTGPLVTPSNSGTS